MSQHRQVGIMDRSGNISYRKRKVRSLIPCQCGKVLSKNVYTKHQAGLVKFHNEKVGSDIATTSHLGF